MRARRQVVIGATVVAVLSSAVAGSLASASPESGGQSAPTTIKADSFGVSVPVRNLDASDSSATGTSIPRVNPLAGEPDAGARGTWDRAGVPGDPLAASSRAASGRTPSPDLVFDGTANPFGCGGCTPPDTTGDVGPNHYIQLVNSTKVAIYNKAGTLQTPAFNLSTLFTTGPCSTQDAGDPQVNYDPLADRWLLSQFTSSNQLCFAVSQTPNPLGAYFLYSFTTPNYPDYFKVGVWPTGYYVGTNESTYTAYALDRTKMLAGNPTATAIRFPGENNFLMPADVDGATAPDNQGGLFYTFKDNVFHGGADRLVLFQLTPNFASPGSSTFTNLGAIPIASFTYTVCGFFNFDCAKQPGTAQGLDVLSEWPMQRFAYRRFGDHEALVGNFTVGGGSGEVGAAIRWFELRNTGSGYSLFQEGTHDPGGNLDRYMGSIAMDADGNIALGYTVSNSAVFPSIRYATRTPFDPAGTLEAEQTMKAGTGSQTSSANRWGDYSAMNVDPANDCNFWYTSEFYSATTATAWKTSIGTFKVPTCPSGVVARQLTVTAAGSGAGFVDSAPAGIDCGQNPPATHVDCSESYANGTVVTLTAHPESDTDFEGFTGGGCSGTATTCAVTMDAAKSVTATFTLKATTPPSNQFTIDKVKRNNKKGTATVTVTVPGPGDLDLSGGGVKPQRPAHRADRRSASSKPVTAAGSVSLKVKPKGKTKKKLKKKGKAKVKVHITYTPTGGASATQTKSVKLKKK